MGRAQKTDLPQSALDVKTTQAQNRRMRTDEKQLAVNRAALKAKLLSVLSVVQRGVESPQHLLPSNPSLNRGKPTGSRLCSGLAMALAVFGLLLGLGCATPVAGPVSRLMETAGPPPVTPPPGKSLVFVHRPLTALKYYYVGVWDGTNFIADLANGHSIAYVCSPGRHIFSSRLVANVAVVEANVLPNQTCDLSTFKDVKLAPVKPGNKERALVSQWMQEACWVARAPQAAEYHLKQEHASFKRLKRALGKQVVG